MAYTPSDSVKKKETDYYAHLYNNKPGEFSSENTEKANKVLSDYENRGQFEYNPATDIGYQAARKQYTEGGRQAMKDTLGTATELTGGYDNSYAQTAAQQTYNRYMEELGYLMPQYEGQAYDRYINEGQQMRDYYSILKNAEAEDYARHQDKVNAYNAESDRLYADLINERNIDYGAYIDQRDYDYQVQQDAIANNQWERTFAHNTAMDNASAAAAQTEAYADYYSAMAKYADQSAGETPDFYTYSGVNDDDKAVFYLNGDTYTFDVGIKPYTGKRNHDIQYGAFKNGYQPDNIKGTKLSETPYQSDDNGIMQNIYTTGDGRFWLWDGKKGMYDQVDHPLKKAASMLGELAGGIAAKVKK